MKKNKKPRILLDRSCAWIREHWNAQNLDVPADLLEQWIYARDDDDPDPMGFHLAVFVFGYFQHELITANVPNGVRRSFPASLILERFNFWQMKLALAEVHRRTEMQVRPTPLFSFPNDEQIEFWQRAPAPCPLVSSGGMS